METTTPSNIDPMAGGQLRVLEALARQDVHEACCGVKGAVGTHREVAKQRLAEALERLWRLNLADTPESILPSGQDERRWRKAKTDARSDWTVLDISQTLALPSRHRCNHRAALDVPDVRCRRGGGV